MAELAGGAGSGPEAEIVAAYERYRGELTAQMIRVTRDPETASDLVQEAFLKLLIEVRGRETPDNVRAWLYRVAGNAAISRGRRNRVAEAYADRLPSPQPELGPEEAALRREAADAVGTLLAGTRPDERRALLMAAAGVSGVQIARAIGRTDVGTRTMLHRARARIREQAALAVA